MNLLSKAVITTSFLVFSSHVALAQPVPTFNDVPQDYWAFSFIEQFAALGITSGCGNGNFCPEDTVTRAQMSVFVMRAIDAVLEHHAFVSVPGTSLRSINLQLANSVQAAYFWDGSVFLSEPGMFVGIGSLQLPDQMRILGMTCAARKIDQADELVIYVLRHPLGAPNTMPNPEIVTSTGLTTFGPEFTEVTAEFVDPNYATVDNANFNYVFLLQMGDSTVADPLTDSAAFRGCSIEMSR